MPVLERIEDDVNIDNVRVPGSSAEVSHSSRGQIVEINDSDVGGIE